MLKNLPAEQLVETVDLGWAELPPATEVADCMDDTLLLESADGRCADTHRVRESLDGEGFLRHARIDLGSPGSARNGEISGVPGGPKRHGGGFARGPRFRDRLKRWRTWSGFKPSNRSG